MAQKVTKDVDLDNMRKVGGTSAEADLYEVLGAYLANQGSKAEFQVALLGVAPYAAKLSPEDRDELRERAMTLLASFSTMIKTAELDGQRVSITKRPKYVETKFGGTFRLTGAFLEGPKGLKPDGSREEWECWLPGSENGQTFRFFTRRNREELYPMTVIFSKEPHQWKDPSTGSLKDGVIWKVERVPEESQQFTGIPF